MYKPKSKASKEVFNYGVGGGKNSKEKALTITVKKFILNNIGNKTRHKNKNKYKYKNNV